MYRTLFGFTFNNSIVRFDFGFTFICFSLVAGFVFSSLPQIIDIKCSICILFVCVFFFAGGGFAFAKLFFGLFRSEKCQSSANANANANAILKYCIHFDNNFRLLHHFILYLFAKINYILGSLLLL